MTSAPSAPDRPVPRQAVLGIAPYVPGRSHAAGGDTLHKLSSNETPLGPSPAAVAAYSDAARTLELYPDPSAGELRRAIARRYGLDAERIVCGAGSDELIALLARAYLDPGDEIIQTRHGFLIYSIAAQASGARTVFAPEPNLVAEVDAILAAVTERTRLVFIANPNNPTGTYIPFAEMKRLAEALPPRVLLVVDAAYAEYVRRNDYSAGLELAGARENVCTLRTFSKVYGLAALRIGWLYGPASVVDAMHRVRGPFNLSTPAIAAGAAAVADTAHVEAAVAHNERWLPWLTAELEALGVTVTPSVGNFVLAHLAGAPGPTAAAADQFLLERGIIVRRMEAYGLPEALRITVGSEAANRAVVAAFAAFLGAGR